MTAQSSVRMHYPKTSEEYFALCREAEAGKFRIQSVAQSGKKDKQQHACLWVVQAVYPERKLL